MTDTPLALAEAEALAARARLAATLETLQSRLDPKAMAKKATQDVVDASEKAARVGAEAVKDNPGKAAGVAAAIGLFLVRKPLLSMLRRRRDR
ncbi:hypothetical protein ASE75_08520 [Sphingomonas sp. Leaf17]|uniref:DUF3618 domain-containing protein n=1 Tax=Sphingomonas sp. Leaf17 TaxID=1735683 RepID=UPI0006F79287|nr:DUF3618 domain-containing protein [Sphingomonas sp. Leaf17]KQM65078.1 hypothetical protein ASE75_08520 [Sphingomonas sp. Leaf17]